MKILSVPSLLLGLTSWVLTVMVTTAMLSGSVETRTCYTSCVQTLFFSAVAAGVLALVLGVIAFLRADTKALPTLTLVVSAPLCMIFAGLILIGSLA